MSRVTRGTPAGDAYLDLRNLARRTGQSTQVVLQLYVLEGFLARLAASGHRHRLVLKGGVLLAAFDARRPTRDVDLAGLGMPNAVDAVLELARDIVGVHLAPDDGIQFFGDAMTAVTIREDEEYSGVRVHVDARLASAELPFHVDVNVGDPIWPAPMTVTVPKLRGGRPIEVQGYPLPMVYAEKLVTAVQRGTANTRWRDFGDIWALSRRHGISGEDLTDAIRVVSGHRRARLRPLAYALDGYVELGRNPWARWRRRSNSEHLPEDLAPVLAAVIAFADPVLAGEVTRHVWNPETEAWERMR